MEDGQTYFEARDKELQEDDANWMFTVSATEINHQVLCSKRSIEELDEER